MKSLLVAIFNIFKGVGKILSLFRSLLFNLIFLAVIAAIVFSVFYSDKPVIPDNSILRLTIVGNIVEQKTEVNPFDETFSDLVGWPSQARETLLQDILDAIDHAADDSSISSILLDLDDMGQAGLNQLQDIGAALISFRDNGKRVIAAEDYYSQNQYYLASYADEIFLNPMGGVYLSGFGLYRLYFKDAIEKLKINYHVFKVGSFKSAIEPLIRSSMSAEDRSQSRAWLTALWNNYVDDVAKQRSLSSADINQYINRIPANLQAVDGDVARLALESGLVDELKTHPEIKRYLNNISNPKPNQELSGVSLNRYLKTITRSHLYKGKDRDTVALIIAQGTIMPGKSNPGTIGSETIAALLRKARTSDHIKAVVLRVDSGGGSAFASEVIRQEILELKKSSKPLIVSMGTFSASGAYWISANADEIWASPNTLTGSIGIFMAVPTFEKALNNVGIYRDGVGTTNLSSGFDLTQPLSSEVKDAIQLTLNHNYKTFLSIVAQGRSLPFERVEKIAQGKVYAGTAALDEGLIDKLGTLSQAIRSAAEHAGLADYATTTLSTPLSFKDRILQRISAGAAALLPKGSALETLLKYLPAHVPAFSTIQLFNDPNSIYAHCMIQYN